MNSKKHLLNVSITGSIPDFSRIYHRYGFDVTHATSLRQALTQIKKISPAVVVAEFVYAPTYGSQLSNFESLLAAMQNFSENASLIAIVYPDDIEHCKKVLPEPNIHSILKIPVAESELERQLDLAVSKK